MIRNRANIAKTAVMIGLLFEGVGCAAGPSDDSDPALGFFDAVSSEARDGLDSLDISRDHVADSGRGQISFNPEKNDGDLDGIPITVNENVRKWIYYFSVTDRARFRRFLIRGNANRSLVQSVLRENGVPPELFYLAMIESGYRTRAKSHAGAVGVWQFMRPTGRRYGLNANYYVDERRDMIRATEAASKYFRDLYNIFNDWYLAMSAYNAGEMRVMGAVMRGKSRNFWDLVNQKVLPRETSNYVPKFLAAMIIGTNPKRFGFDDVNVEAHPGVEVVEIPSPVRLKHVALVTGVSLATLRKLNPNIRRGITPPYEKSYEIWVPQGARAEFADPAIQKKLASYRVKGLNRRYLASRANRVHRVRRGENLSSIAKKYRISVGFLKRVNSLRGDRIRVGQKLRVASRGYKASVKPGYYRVQNGDSLSTIARKHRVSIRNLKRMNGMRRSKIYAGQLIKIQRDAI